MSDLEQLEGTCSGKLKSQVNICGGFYMLSVKYVQSGMQKITFRLHPLRRGEVWLYAVALEKVSVV